MGRRGLVAVALGLLIFIGLATGASSCSSSSDNKSSGNSSSGGGQSAKSGSSCGTKATDDCTPHVGSTGRVRVDALVWKVLSARTASELGNTSLGLGHKADGIYVVVKLQVHSVKSESATLTSDVIQLEANGRRYSPDDNGTIAAVEQQGNSSASEPFFVTDISPDSTKRGIAVYDVPKRLLSKNVEVRFNELGFGQTHGYIKLPTPTSE
jgi:hypothetical protein